MIDHVTAIDRVERNRKVSLNNKHLVIKSPF